MLAPVRLCSLFDDVPSAPVVARALRRCRSRQHQLYDIPQRRIALTAAAALTKPSALSAPRKHHGPGTPHVAAMGYATCLWAARCCSRSALPPPLPLVSRSETNFRISRNRDNLDLQINAHLNMKLRRSFSDVQDQGDSSIVQGVQIV